MCCEVQVWSERLCNSSLYSPDNAPAICNTIVHFLPVRKSQFLWALLWQSSLLHQDLNKNFWRGTELQKIFIYSKAIKRIVLLVGKNEIQQPIIRCIAPVAMLDERPASWLLAPWPQQAALAIILLTHPCGTDPLLGLFVANACVTATLRTTERETGAAAPQLKSQALWLKQFVPSVDYRHERQTIPSP